MPVGVPQLPPNRLYRARFVFLGKEVKDQIANQIAGLMVFLTIEDKEKTIYFYINSPGGLVLPGLGIYNAMQTVEPPVHTICVGKAVSTASFLLATGEATKRLSLPNAKVMMHQPASSFLRDRTGNCSFDGDQILYLRNIIIEAYVVRTGKPFEVINRDLDRDDYMTPEEARAYGLVDLVGYERP
uniref:clp protease proteolytic subunit n=1 Tax=Littorella uniflora TaxID=223169 RepID=UPI002238DAEE|nr:clp protease proteolytic subunit [Littorella uniflora]UYG22619.1 clp protease proteolytic subunit [Littorella uniflora]